MRAAGHEAAAKTPERMTNAWDRTCSFSHEFPGTANRATGAGALADSLGSWTCRQPPEIVALFDQSARSPLFARTAERVHRLELRWRNDRGCARGRGSA